MITLNHNGQIYRFLSRYSYPPMHTDLCSLCWQVLLHFLFLTAAGSVVGIYIIGWVTLFLVPEHWTGYITFAISSIAGAIATLAGIFWLLDRVRDTQTTHLVGEAYRGIKEKYCPLVEFKGK